MANNDKNDKGKSLLIGGEESSEKSWGKVLLNDEVFEDVLDEFGDKVIVKYCSYANIGKEMIVEILQWMWNRTFNKPNVGASGAISIPTIGSSSHCSNEVVAEKQRGRGRPVGSGKKKKEGSPNPTTITEKRNRGRPVGTGKKKKEGNPNPSTVTEKRKRGR